jgi:EmrB/QacA subfamily drug resistance transporter
MVLFMLGSVGSGIAQDSIQLIVARIVQGVGAGLLAPQTLSIIFVTFDRAKLGAAFGIFGAITSLAAVLGPTVGGIIVTYLSWRWIFFINVPIGIIAIATTLWKVPELKIARGHKLDVPGIILAILSIFTICYALIEGPRYGWLTIVGFINIPEIWILGVLFMVAFLLVEARQSEPLIPLQLFADRNFSLASIISGALFFSQYGLAIVAIIYLQSVLRLTPLQSGLIYFPLSLLAMFAAPLSGFLSSKLSGKMLVIIGLSAYALGIFLFAVFAAIQTPWWWLIPIFALTGLGAGTSFPPLFAIGLYTLDQRLAGAASGVSNATRQLGGVIGSAIIGAILQSLLAVNLNNEAIARVNLLPGNLQNPFLSAVQKLASQGLQISTTDGSVSLPITTHITQQMEGLYHVVFINAYVEAMRPTLIVPVAVLVICVLASITIRRPKAHGEQEIVPDEQKAASALSTESNM